MVIFKALLTGLHVITSVLLTVIILLQSSKGGGLSGTFGGQASTALFGARGTATILSKVTQYLAAIFLILSLTLSLLAGAGSTPTSVTQEVLETTPAEFLPPVENLDLDASTPGGPVSTPGAGSEEGNQPAAGSPATESTE